MNESLLELNWMERRVRFLTILFAREVPGLRLRALRSIPGYLWVSGRSGVSSATAFAALAQGWQLLRAGPGVVLWVLRGSGPHVGVRGPHRASEYVLVKGNPRCAVEGDCGITYRTPPFQAGIFTQLTSHTADNRVSTNSEGWKPCGSFWKPSGSFSLTTKQSI